MSTPHWKSLAHQFSWPTSKLVTLRTPWFQTPTIEATGSFLIRDKIDWVGFLPGVVMRSWRFSQGQLERITLKKGRFFNSAMPNAEWNFIEMLRETQLFNQSNSRMKLSKQTRPTFSLGTFSGNPWPVCRVPHQVQSELHVDAAALQVSQFSCQGHLVQAKLTNCEKPHVPHLGITPW